MNKDTSYLSSFSSQLDLLESEGRYMEMSNGILNLMVRNVDLSPLAGKIIRFLAIPHPPFKKVIYSFLTRYSSRIADLNILATNSVLKDFQDPNPFIRRLVIKTICLIPCLSELAFQLLPQALCDGSSYVRCTSASSCSLIINKTNVKDNQDIINKLYEMIRDLDPTVVCSSLSALNEILHSDGGVVINSKITCYLLSRILEFQEWNMSIIYTVLKKYVPKNGEELLRFLNALDEKLLDSNPAVFLLAADLALNYIRLLNKEFSRDIIEQILPQLKLLLNQASVETLAGILEVIEMYLPEHREIFTSFYKLFFCRFCDTIVVKVKKLKILPHLIDSNNALDITEELLSHCCDNTKEVSHQAVNSFTEIITKHAEIISFINTFVILMDIQHNDLSEEILNALSVVNLNETSSIKTCVLAAISKHASNVNNSETKLSLLKLIGNYGEDIEDSPYIIEQIFADEENSENERLMSVLLTTTVKLFLSRPGEMHFLLGCILQSAKKSHCLLLRKQASVYYHLLKDPTLAKKVMQVNAIPLSNVNSVL